MGALALVPRWVWEALGGALLILGLVFAEQAYEHHLIANGDAAGYARANGEWERKEAKITADAEVKASKKTAEAEAKTATLQAEFDKLADDRQKEKANHEKDTARHVAAAIAGTERLHNPDGGTCGALPGTENGQGAEAGSGTPPEARADLLPGTAATILRIAGDYGQLVRDYNTVLDRYQRIEAACNGSTHAVTNP